MNLVHFKPSSDFKERVDALFLEQKKRITHVLPAVDIQHIGGTAVPGLLTKGDVDINVRVDAILFPGAVEEFKKLYHINQPDNWTSAFASFKDDDSFALPLGVQLTVIGTSDDHFVRHRDALLRDPTLVGKFNDLKRRFESKDMDEYRAAKSAFLAER
jgi:GrpB-like predicted nucleotidyltransferase (UPF0157 family)